MKSFRTHPEKTEAFKQVVDEMQRLYKNTLTEREAAEAARNFIGFTQLYLEVSRRVKV